MVGNFLINSVIIRKGERNEEWLAKVKENVNSLFTPMRRIGVVEVQLHRSFSSALDGGECSVSHAYRFATGEEIVAEMRGKKG
jgi:hypothetical protein